MRRVDGKLSGTLWRWLEETETEKELRMGGRPQPHGENKPCKKEKQPSASMVLANKEVTGNLFPE